MRIDRFVALRYLRPRRGRGLLSVVTAIAIVGFAAGVAALILAMAVTNGFREALQQELVGATAQLDLILKQPEGFAHYRELMARLRQLPHVEAVAPVVYDEAYISYGARGGEATLKGIIPQEELKIGNLLNHTVEGSWKPLEQPSNTSLLLGKDLADQLGVTVGDWVEIYVPHAVLTPFGYSGRSTEFQVAGIFQSGFGDIDGSWVFAPLAQVQRLHPESAQADRVSAIEFRLDDIYQANAAAEEAQKVAGPRFTTTTWISQNRPIFQALKLEQLGTVIVIGLIVFVAALNVLIMLTMLVMEKRREIAVLLSFGTRRAQIRRIFILQGLLIAAAGTAVGLVLGYGLAELANRYRWIHISAAVYAINYVPFRPGLWDGVWVTVLALGVSFLATLYPSSRAVRVLPAETLRYE